MKGKPIKRVLRRSRKSTSSYRVNLTKKRPNIQPSDEITLNIYDEKDKNIRIATYVFRGTDVIAKPDPHFKAVEVDGLWKISFYGKATPQVA